jgi:FKBP-type peptidyl-prolyl cis-trans isomerase 2
LGQVGTITDVTNTSVVIDFNHRLSGKTLIFDVKLVSIGSDKGNTMADTTEKTGEENRIADIETTSSNWQTADSIMV